MECSPFMYLCYPNISQDSPRPPSPQNNGYFNFILNHLLVYPLQNLFKKGNKNKLLNIGFLNLA